MDITIDKPSDCSATLQATVPASDVSQLQDSITATYAAQAQIPGFRCGKAPKKVILKRFADAIREELESRLSERVADEALAQNPDLKVLDFGKPETNIQEDGSFTYTTSLTVIPAFDLPEYMGFEVSVPSDEVSDAEIDEALDQFAQQNAKFEPVDREAAMGDVAVIDFTTTVDGKPTVEALGKPVGFLEGREGHWVYLEKDSFMPGLAEGLVGTNTGDKKDIAISVPENFPFAELVGKELVFHTETKEVREKQVPEVNAELFASAVPGKTLNEIRTIVRDNLKQKKETDNNELKADQISEQLADTVTFELPEPLVEQEMYNTLQRKMYAAMQAGEKDIEGAMEKMRDEAREETRRNLRVYFIVQDIARKENIDVTDQEIMTAIARMAQQEKATNMKSFVKKLRKEGRLPGVRLSILTSKTIDLLVKNAKVTVTTNDAKA